MTIGETTWPLAMRVGLVVIAPVGILTRDSIEVTGFVLCEFIEYGCIGVGVIDVGVRYEVGVSNDDWCTGTGVGVHDGLLDDWLGDWFDDWLDNWLYDWLYDWLYIWLLGWRR